MEEKLKELAGKWAGQEGREFEVYGLPVMQYIDELWNSHDKHREQEKNKRVSGEEITDFTSNKYYDDHISL